MNMIMQIVVGAFLLVNVYGCATDAVYVTTADTDTHSSAQNPTLHSERREVAMPQPATMAMQQQDWDDDGFAVEQDCNDKNANVYPGAYEFCDYLDNDCDGQTDETWKSLFSEFYGNKCWVMQTNGCVSEGIWGCDFSHDWLECTAAPRTVSYERCNGEDDDCNGITDTDEWPFLGKPCQVITEGCVRTGIQVCDSYTEDVYCTAEDKPITPENCSSDE